MANLLALSRVLFVLFGAFWFLIGTLTPFALDAKLGTGGLFFTARADNATFGGAPADLMARDPALHTLRNLLLTAVAGLLVAGGLLVAAVAWFALPSKAPWAFWTLAAAGAVVLPFWLLILRAYVAAGSDFGLGDVPPFMWVNTALWLPATVFGWLGLHE